jgi:hypothetical protein
VADGCARRTIVELDRRVGVIVMVDAAEGTTSDRPDAAPAGIAAAVEALIKGRHPYC